MPCTHADRTSTAASDARAVWARVQVCACDGRISFCGNSADHNCRNLDNICRFPNWVGNKQVGNDVFFSFVLMI